MDFNTFLQNMPLLMGLVAIVYWTSIAKPFITNLTDLANGHRDALDGSDFTRLFTAAISVGVSFAFPAATVPLTLLQGATLAAIADGTYTKILKKFIAEEQELTTLTVPAQVVGQPVSQPLSHLGQTPTPPASS